MRLPAGGLLLLALSLSLGLASPAIAGDNSWAPPRGAEVAQVVALEALVAVDVVTTILALRRPGAYEMNPLLGAHPSPARVAWMGAGGGVLLAALWYALPPRQRWVVPVFAGAAEVAVVSGNVALLLRW